MTGCNAGPGTVGDLEKEECVLAQGPLIELIQTVLNRGSSIRLRARGYSMDPFIKDGDVLALSPIAAGKPKFGDIVAFKLGEKTKLVIHRVIQTSADSCLVKGDCCSEPDGRIPQKDILGLVSGVERDGRKIRFGLGPEKVPIAFLSGKNRLWPLGSLLVDRSAWRSSAV